MPDNLDIFTLLYAFHMGCIIKEILGRRILDFALADYDDCALACGV